VPGLSGKLRLFFLPPSDAQGRPPSFPTTFGDATSASPGPPPITRITFPACCAHYPGGSAQVRLSVALFPVPFGLPRYAGGSASTTYFRGLLKLHAVTACRIAHPPFVGFITRLRPTPVSRFRTLASYQVLPTTTWVGPSPTGVPRLWGALHRILCIASVHPRYRGKMRFSLGSEISSRKPLCDGLSRNALDFGAHHSGDATTRSGTCGLRIRRNRAQVGYQYQSDTSRCCTVIIKPLRWTRKWPSRFGHGNAFLRTQVREIGYLPHRTRKGRPPYWQGTLWRYYGKPALQRAKVTKQVSYHSFRHTFGTLLNANRENPKVVCRNFCAEARGAEQFGQANEAGRGFGDQARLTESNWIMKKSGDLLKTVICWRPEHFPRASEER
jgi:hypothetical protein